MKDLDALLGEGEPEEKRTIVDNGLDSLYITKYAFEKAYVYARLTCKRARYSMECGGYLIAPKDSKDRIVTDAFLARNQDVSGGSFTIEAEDVIKAGREIDEIGHKVLGWWHSHGNMSTFFSSTDDDGQMTILNEIAAFNYIAQNEEKRIENLEVIARDGRIVMFDRRSPERKYEIEVNGNLNNISIAGLRLQQEKRTGFAYGLVVNAWKRRREPYAEIAIRELCGFCRESRDKSIPADVTLFDRGEFEIDRDALIAEIKERVNIWPRASSSWNKRDDKESWRYSIGDEVRVTKGYYSGMTGKIVKLDNSWCDVVTNDKRRIFPYLDSLELIKEPINPRSNENNYSDKKNDNSGGKNEI